MPASPNPVPGTAAPDFSPTAGATAEHTSPQGAEPAWQPAAPWSAAPWSETPWSETPWSEARPPETWGGGAADNSPAVASAGEPPPAAPVIVAAASRVAPPPAGTPAGWLPDPNGTPDTLRYWDGGAWTQHFARRG
jgi:hypothetical protein